MTEDPKDEALRLAKEAGVVVQGNIGWMMREEASADQQRLFA